MQAVDTLSPHPNQQSAARRIRKLGFKPAEFEVDAVLGDGTADLHAFPWTTISNAGALHLVTTWGAFRFR